MALFLIFLSGVFVSLSNLCMRKSIDEGGTTKGFLVFQMAMAFLVAVLLNPVKTKDYAFNGPVALLGVTAGLILAAMLFSLGRALEKGPPGLTFSILNGSTVMPAIVMTTIFGSALGFPYTAWHAIGSLLVVFGLFWSGKGLQGMTDQKKWVTFCFAMFSLHVLLLVLLQTRALLLNLPHPEELVSFFTAEQIKSQWFMPFMFLASGIVQLTLFLSYEKRLPRSREMFYGLFGGAANGLCTYFMIQATEAATPLENAIIFPVFSIVGIILSNLWGQKLYQEQVNWKACQLCAFGLIVGTVDWKGLAAIIGF